MTETYFIIDLLAEFVIVVYCCVFGDDLSKKCHDRIIAVGIVIQKKKKINKNRLPPVFTSWLLKLL